MKPHAAAPSAAPLTALDIERLRADFPILHTTVRGRRLVYLDNAATTQKPNAVIEAESDYYRTSNANIHRGLHHLSERSTELYERTRQHTARFIGGVDP